MHRIGLDIGGTKIAGGVFSPDGALLAEMVVPTPQDYKTFLNGCCNFVKQLSGVTGASTCSAGVGIAGRIDREAGTVIAPNLPFLAGKPFRDDLGTLLNRNIHLANDADCMTLAEAVDGAGAGYNGVLGLVLGTGVGGGFVCKGRLLEGANGLAGEIGHLPLPFREEADGPLEMCGCKQQGCLDKSISGGGLARLYAFMTGKEADAKTIASLTEKGDAEASRVLDRYYEVVAKAMAVILHTFDPDIIVVSGGLCSLPGLYEEVPKRWGRYAVVSCIKTKIAPARHGPLAGVRGAAWLGRV